MPHVIVKLWPGKSEKEKKKLAEEITNSVCRELNYGPDSVSVAFEEISSADWKEEVYKKDILGRPDQLYKKPGYRM